MLSTTFIHNSFKAYAQKEKVMDAYQLFMEIASSSGNDEAIKKMIAQFLNFMNEITVKGDEVKNTSTTSCKL